MEDEADVIEMEREELVGGDQDIMEQPVEARVVKYSVTMAQIAKLKEKYKVVPADLSVKANYELVRKGAAEIRGYRVDVEKRRKELKADALAWGKKVDSAAKELTERLLEIEEPYAAAKKEYDTAEEIKKREAALAEEKRIDGIAERIAGIKALVEANISSDSAVIMQNIMRLDSHNPIEQWAMEFSEKASQVIEEARVKLHELYNMKLQQENFARDQAAAEEARKIKEEEDRKKREAEVEAERKKIAEEREAMEAEKARLAAEQKTKDDAAAEAERKRVEVYEADLKRLADEQAEKDRIQKARDDAAAEELARLKAEMEALKKSQESTQAVQEKPVEVATAPAVEPSPDQTEQNQEDVEADYKAAGRAMIQFIGNRAVTKNLLDAIINNEVPNIQFTGRK